MLQRSRAPALAGAARAFGVTAAKGEADYAGAVTPKYIEYLRQDLRVTHQLLEALRAEFDRHPIGVDPWHLLSPASVAKGYQRVSGMTPLRSRAADIPESVFGAHMVGFFGGRTECGVTRLIAPVVPTDFTAMYPTVQTLARFDEWLTAASLHTEDWATEARRVLDAVTLDRCLTPECWPELRFLALIEPDGNILPLRAQYDAHQEAFTIGVNAVTSPTPIRYTGFDLAASKLIGSKTPRIIRAVAVVAVGQAESLQPALLRGTLPLDPRAGGYFRRIVEMRRAVRRDRKLRRDEKKRLDTLLKGLVNSGSYGIFAVMIAQAQRPGVSAPVRVSGGLT